MALDAEAGLVVLVALVLVALLDLAALVLALLELVLDLLAEEAEMGGTARMLGRPGVGSVVQLQPLSLRAQASPVGALG